MLPLQLHLLKLQLIIQLLSFLTHQLSVKLLLVLKLTFQLLSLLLQLSPAFPASPEISLQLTFKLLSWLRHQQTLHLLSVPTSAVSSAYMKTLPAELQLYISVHFNLNYLKCCNSKTIFHYSCKWLIFKYILLCSSELPLLKHWQPAGGKCENEDSQSNPVIKQWD